MEEAKGSSKGCQENRQARRRVRPLGVAARLMGVRYLMWIRTNKASICLTRTELRVYATGLHERLHMVDRWCCRSVERGMDLITLLSELYRHEEALIEKISK